MSKENIQETDLTHFPGGGGSKETNGPAHEEDGQEKIAGDKTNSVGNVNQEETNDAEKVTKEAEILREISSSSSPPFTIFNDYEKYILILSLSLTGFWSTVSSPIYFPALPTLERYFGVDSSVMNLSVVAYLVFQGIAPTFVSSASDQFGRRLVVLMSVLIFFAACIGISQTRVFWLLAVLRCVQAGGIGPVIAITSGVAGDVCLASNRGSFIGTVTGFQLAGNGFAGVMGAGLIHQFNSWRAIFLFLAIGAAASFIVIFICLPETNRRVVGNGSVLPSNKLNYSLLLFLPYFKQKMKNDISTITPKGHFNVFAPFKILGDLTVLSVLFAAGLHFASWSVVLTSLSNVLQSSSYNYSVMHVGYIYLPQGLTSLIGPLISGKFLDAYYKSCKKSYDYKYKDFEEHDKPKFDMHKTRLVACIPLTTVTIMGLVIFGWCLHYARNISSIIISTCLISFGSSSFVSVATTMLVDLYPRSGSSVISCVNLLRCLLAALFVGVLDKIINVMGLGWCYTLFTFLILVADLYLVYQVITVTKRG